MLLCSKRVATGVATQGRIGVRLRGSFHPRPIVQTSQSSRQVDRGTSMSIHCPVVLEVWFSKHENITDWLPMAHEIREGDQMFGLRVWKTKEGKAVMRWVVDYVSVSDERYVVVRPYDGEAAARKAFQSAFPDESLTFGYRIEKEHCFEHRKKFPHAVYTDG